MWQHSKSKILHLVHLSLQTCLSVAGGPGLFTLTGTPIQGGIQGYIGSVSKTSDSSLFRAEFCAEPKKLLFWREVVQES